MPRSGWTKLTEDQVRGILHDAVPCKACGEVPAYGVLAFRHGTSRSTVCRVLSGSHRYSMLAEEETDAAK